MKEIFEEMMSMNPNFRGRPRGPGRGGGRGRFGPGRQETRADRKTVEAWLAGRLPQEWQVSPSELAIDDDEVLVVAHLPEVNLPDNSEPGALSVAENARINGFREETRERRMQIASEGEAALGRAVSWGAACGNTRTTFTTTNIPVMTRLRMADRQVLDTLIAAGVARSRSDALNWCVQLVGRNEGEWISDLRSAFEAVEAVRSRGPAGAQGSE